MVTSKSTVIRNEKKVTTSSSAAVVQNKAFMSKLTNVTKPVTSVKDVGLSPKTQDFKHKRTNSMSLGSLHKPDVLTRDDYSSVGHREAFSSKYTQSFIVPSTPSPLVNNEQKEDIISASLKDSLKIMEKIQLEFENSARMNNVDRNMKSFVVNMDHEAANNYCYVSDYEKQIINNTIVETSENRLNNYSKLFNIINTSLKDIKDTLLEYKDKKGKC